MTSMRSFFINSLLVLTMALSPCIHAKGKITSTRKSAVPNLPPLKLRCESDPDQKLLSGDIFKIRPLIPAIFDADLVSSLISSNSLTVYFDSSRGLQGDSPWTLSRNNISKSYCELTVSLNGFKPLSTNGKVASQLLKVPMPDDQGCVFTIQQATRGMIWAKPDPHACPSNPAEISSLTCHDPENLFSAQSIQQVLSSKQEFIHIDRGCRPPGVQAVARAAMSRFRRQTEGRGASSHGDCAECQVAAHENAGAPMTSGQKASFENVENEMTKREDRRAAIQALLKQNPNDPEAVRLVRLEHEEMVETMIKSQESVTIDESRATMTVAPEDMTKPYKNCGVPPPMPADFLDLNQKAAATPEVKSLEDQISSIATANPSDPRLGSLIKQINLLIIHSMGRNEKELSDEKLLKLDQELYKYEHSMREFSKKCDSK